MASAATLRTVTRAHSELPKGNLPSKGFPTYVGRSQTPAATYRRTLSYAALTTTTTVAVARYTSEGIYGLRLPLPFSPTATARDLHSQREATVQLGNNPSVTRVFDRMFSRVPEPVEEVTPVRVSGAIVDVVPPPFPYEINIQYEINNDGDFHRVCEEIRTSLRLESPAMLRANAAEGGSGPRIDEEPVTSEGELRALIYRYNAPLIIANKRTIL